MNPVQQAEQMNSERVATHPNDQSAQSQDKAQTVFECVRTDARFEQLAEPWQLLEAKSATDFAFFQSFAWCSQWWRTVGARNKDASLNIMTLWQADKLVAVWPLMTDILPFGARGLLPLTSPHAEYSNLIFDPKAIDQATLQQFVDDALSQFDGDLISLPNLPTGSALHGAVQHHGTPASKQEIASYSDLSQYEDFEQYQSTLSKSKRRNRNKRKNKLARMGDLSYQTFFADTPEFAGLVNVALEMKRDWLKRSGRNDAKLMVDGLAQCIGGVAGNSQTKSGAVAGALMLDGKPVALEIGFLQNGHYYSYIGAFDWGMHEYSVGKVQIEEALKWAIEVGARKYDLLAEPAGYKDAWSNNQLPLQTRTIARSARGYIVGIIWQLHMRPFAKSIFNQLPSDWRLKVLQVVRTLRGHGNNKAS